MDYWRAALERDGFAVVEDLLDAAEVTALIEALGDANRQNGARRRSSVYAIRNLLSSSPAVSTLANGTKLMTLARSVLGEGAKPVKGTLFDKTGDANWLVPWHQDLTICVQERRAVEGYGPWTIKSGAINVQPPAPVLERMLAIRIHLDDCGERNGALRVLPGTHRLGRLSDAQIAPLPAEIAPATCSVRRGGAVLMRPLAVHASSAADTPTHRRVVHIEYAGVELAAGLSWAV